MNSIFNIFGVRKGSKSFSSFPKTSAAETGHMPSVGTGRRSAVPEGSGFAWACGPFEVAPAGD